MMIIRPTASCAMTKLPAMVFAVIYLTLLAMPTFAQQPQTSVGRPGTERQAIDGDGEAGDVARRIVAATRPSEERPGIAIPREGALNVKSYGAIGDGSSHILKGSAGMLSTCPELKPPVEQDACAAQAAIDSAEGRNGPALWFGEMGARIYFPGTGHPYMLGDATLIANDVSIAMMGDGQLETELEWTGTVDGIHYGLNPTHQLSGSLRMQDMSLLKDGPGGVAILARFNQTHPTFDVDNVRISGAGAVENGSDWATGIILINADDSQVRRSVLRGYTKVGIGDYPTIAGTKAHERELVFAALPSNVQPGETVDDLTHPMAIPDGCTVRAVAGNSLTMACETADAIERGDFIAIRSVSIAVYAPQPSLGHFEYNYLDGNSLNFPSAGLVWVARYDPGIQGVYVRNWDVSGALDAYDFYNTTSHFMPQIWFDHNQVQVVGNFLHCERCYNLLATGNIYYLGSGGKTAPHPVVPSSAFMFDLVGGNLNQFVANTMALFPNAPPVAGFARSSDNHDTFMANIIGGGAVGPIATGYQFIKGAANSRVANDQIYVVQTLTAAGDQPPGGSELQFENFNSNLGRMIIPGEVVSDRSRARAIPNDCPVEGVTGSGNISVRIGCRVSDPGVHSGDKLTFSGLDASDNVTWIRTYSGSSGSRRLYFEPYFFPKGVAADDLVTDLTHSDMIPRRCEVDRVEDATGEVTLSCQSNADAGDTISFIGRKLAADIKIDNSGG